MGSSTASKKKKKKAAQRSVTAAGKQLAVAAMSDGDDTHEAYRKWTDYLQQRSAPAPLAKLLPSKQPAVLWGVSTTHLAPGAGRDFLSAINNIADKRPAKLDPSLVEQWRDSLPSRSDLIPLGLEAVAVAQVLPQLSVYLSRESWQALLDALTQLVRETSSLSKPGAPWPSQILSGELPLVLAYQFPEIPSLHAYAEEAVLFITDSVDALLDGSGMPEAPNFGLLRPLLACWLRCLVLAKSTRKIKFTKPVKQQVDWLVRHALRFTRKDGSHIFGPSGDPNDDFISLLNGAHALFGNDSDKSLTTAVLKGIDVVSSRLPTEPSFESEWAGVAMLQPEWSPDEPRLATLFHQQRVEVELAVKGKQLLAGEWSASISVDGTPLQAVDDWGSVCWYSDFDADYLELETKLSGGWKLQRQFLMARQDYFLFVADVLSGPAEAEIDYHLQLPLAEGTTFRGNEHTTEGFLARKSASALLLPLGVPEWKSEARRDRLVSTEGALALHHERRGQRLYAPLFMDLHPRRLKKKCTWRRLTVGESLAITPPDMAAGFRIHVGPEQWLAYRSLGKPANRTVLGQNLISEFFFSRFMTDGDSDVIVEIE